MGVVKFGMRDMGWWPNARRKFFLFGLLFGADHGPMATDAELLGRYSSEGSEDAFRELVERRFGLVYAVALRQVGGDAPLAQDVAQHVFSKLARQASSVSTHPVISGWLYRTARFTAIDVVRGERRRKVREAEAQLMQDMPNNDLDWTNLRSTLDEAITAMGEKDRDMVMLRLFEERPFREIGRALQISEDAARMRFERALGRLREQLHRRGITSTAAALAVALSPQAFATAPLGLAGSIAGAALAGVKLTTSASVITSLTAFMTMKPIPLISTVIAVLALSVGVNQAYHARADAAEAFDLQFKIADLNLRIDAYTRSEPMGAIASPIMVGDTTPALVAASEKEVLAAEVERVRKAYEANRQLRETNLEYQHLQLQRAKVAARLDYAPDYHRWGLTAGQISEFEELMAQRAASQMDIAAAIRSEGLQPDDPLSQELSRAEEERFERAMQELLGESGFSRFMQREKLAPVRALIGQVAGAVHHTTAPLTAEQSVRLSEIIVRHHPHLQNPGHAWRKDGVDWNATVSEAQYVLTPAQLTAWRDVIALVEWEGEIIKELNRR